MNQKLRLVTLIILALFISALISRNAALAWMTLPFLFYLGAGLLTTPQEVSLSASRTVSLFRCEAGTPVTMTVTIVNHGPAIPNLRVCESFHPKIRLSSRFQEPCGILPAGGEMKGEYIFQAPRGQYCWENIRVTVSDPFGLFDKTIDLAAEAELLVLPGQVRVKPPEFHPRHTIRAPGANLSRLPGSGIDFFGVRAYYPGDPLRWIHWRLSARYPKQLFSKEFEREEMADICLILDGAAAMNLKNETQELFEVSVEAAAVLAQGILRAGNRLSMLLLGNRVVRVFPGTGKHQLAHILNQLAACEPGENVNLNMLKYLPVKLFPRRALIILVTPLRINDTPAIARLLARGYQVLIVSPDPVKFTNRCLRQSLAVRAAVVERTAQLWHLRKLGARVFEWPVDQPQSTEREKRIQHLEER